MPSSSEFLAVPADVSARSARIWVGSTVEHPADPAQVWIEHPASGARWPVAAWQRWTVPGDAASFIRHDRVTLNGLRPHTRYPLVLKVGGAVHGQLEITTFPERLPAPGEPPFTILVGSCFCRMQDASGRVGRTFAQLPGGAKPHMKLLVGDQVYLDSPWYRFTTPQTATGLGRGFLEHYVRTWSQRSDHQGFNHLLSAGANYFSADDHEFWNNGPYPSSFAVNTWTGGGRDSWWTQAQGLYRAFQSPASFATMNVGALSIAMLDTRINRRADRSAFITAADIAAFERWVSDLTAPGMLVVGQPLFATKAGFRGRFADWNLPDFYQYSRLSKAILDSRQSIVVITGDVHYGRIATAPLRSGAELVEIISSPMALVDRTAGGSWQQAPERFPADPIPGVAGVQITNLTTWRRFANHFITLECTARGGGLNLRIRTWETEPADGITDGMVVAERFFKKVA